MVPCQIDIERIVALQSKRRDYRWIQLPGCPCSYWLASYIKGLIFMWLVPIQWYCSRCIAKAVAWCLLGRGSLWVNHSVVSGKVRWEMIWWLKSTIVCATYILASHKIYALWPLKMTRWKNSALLLCCAISIKWFVLYAVSSILLFLALMLRSRYPSSRWGF